MAPSARSRSQGHHALALLRRAQDAQRHHHLTFAFRALDSQDLRRGLSALVRLGIVGHVRSERPLGGPGRGLREVTCTLRYWEGEPLVGVTTSPMRQCSYHDLRRRAALGGGVGLLLWSGGRLQTARDCLAARAGGRILAVVAG